MNMCGWVPAVTFGDDMPDLETQPVTWTHGRRSHWQTSASPAPAEFGKTQSALSCPMALSRPSLPCIVLSCPTLFVALGTVVCY